MSIGIARCLIGLAAASLVSTGRPAVAQTGDASLKSELTIADLLFPESVAWPALDTLPALRPEELDEHEAEHLWAMVDSHHDSRLEDSKGCEAGMRLFFSPGAAAHFHPMDFGTGRRDGRVYSGSAPCGGMHMTLVWRNAGAYPPATAEFAGNLALRLQPGADPLYTGVDVGCCAAVVDVHMRRSLFRRSGRNFESYTINKDLVLPDRIRIVHRESTLDRELVLRSAPKTDDAYDESKSHFLSVAAYGNIIGRYLPGAQVTVLGEWDGPDGDRWDFVTVDPNENDHLRTYSTTGAQAGWMVEP